MTYIQVPKTGRPTRPTPMRQSRINPPKPPEPMWHPKPPDTPNWRWTWKK